MTWLERWTFGRRDGMRHRTLAWPFALLIVVALHLGAAAVLTGLTVNNAAEVYYTPGSPAVELRDQMRRDFPTDEALTVLFHGESLYSAEFLGRLNALAVKLEQHPLVDRVTTVLSFERISGSDDGFAVEPLVDGDRLGDATPEMVRHRVLDDQFAPGLLASRDGRHLAMAVRPVMLNESTQRLALKNAVMAAIEETGLQPHYVGDAGQITIDVAQLDSILRDTEWLVPLTVAIGLALLWWVVGRITPVIIGGIAMSTVVAPTIAGVVALGQPYTMATAILPSLLAAYTTATLLHLYAGLQQAQRNAQGRAEAVDRALAETRRPSAFNVLTTAAGLLSLVLVPMPPVQVFGMAGAAGTVLVFLTVFFLVPPLLLRWDQRPWPQHASGMGRLARVAKRLALVSMRRPKTVLAVLAVAIVAGVPYVQKVQVQTDLLAFFSDDHPINVDTRRIESTLTGVTTLEVSLRGAGRDAFQSVETLLAVKRLQQAIESLPEVDRSISMIDLVEEMHWAMNGERRDFRAIPPNDRLLRQYLLVYDGNDLYELVNREFDHARIVLNLNVHGTREIERTIAAIRARAAAEPLAGVTAVDVGGYGRLLADQAKILVDGQVRSFAGAFAQIFLLMAILLRSVRAAAVCMAPNLAPLFFIFVLMGAAEIPLDLATVMIASVVLGITVDDTIHLYHGYRKRLQAGASPLSAIARSYESAGRAVLATSAILIAQFALFTMSDFVPTASFGLMTAIGLLAGLLFEVLLLPALLVLTRGSPSTARPASAIRHSTRAASKGGLGHTATPSGGVSLAAPATVVDTASTADAPTPRRVLVCHGDGCKRAGAARLWRRLRDEQQNRAESEASPLPLLTKTSCLGPCKFAPVLQIYPEGTYYGLLEGPVLERVVREHLIDGREVKDLALPPQATPTTGA